MYDLDVTIALKEEIGNPQLFTGREQELNELLHWSELVRGELGDSMVLLARKRRGKTALVQRFYNILYTRNDPKIIPIYYRVPEAPTPYEAYTLDYFLNLVTQYLVHKLRRPEIADMGLGLKGLRELASYDPILVQAIQGAENRMSMGPDHGWKYVREFGHKLSTLKDERIIQIIDEFQYMSKYIIRDGEPINLCLGYQMTGSSKISPQIITGSYIGWLSAIVDHMVGRYEYMKLDPLPPDEALSTVYNYASFFKKQITPQDAAYLVELCHCDPYYIARCFKTKFPVRGPMNREVIAQIMDFETDIPGGAILRMWGDYILSAIEKVNDRNAKRIILYLAKYPDQEFTRKQILQDLNLDLTDLELEKRMTKLVKSDILHQGSSMSRYRGLGDPIFELVFRRLYQEEIEDVDAVDMETWHKKRYASLQGKLSNVKGLEAEQRVRYYLIQVGRKQLELNQLSQAPVQDGRFGAFLRIKKHSLHLTQDQRVELDLLARAESEEDPDVVVEVKNLTRPVGAEQVNGFIQRKKQIQPQLTRPTVFMMYSESGFTGDHAALLASHQILACSGQLLKQAAED